MLTMTAKLQYCQGCYNDFYNGNNPFQVQQCWHLKNAVLVEKRRVSLHEPPPWLNEPELVLNCYTAPGFVFVRPDVHE